jgi:hypothetical protein
MGPIGWFPMINIKSCQRAILVTLPSVLCCAIGDAQTISNLLGEWVNADGQHIEFLDENRFHFSLGEGRYVSYHEHGSDLMISGEMFECTYSFDVLYNAGQIPTKAIFRLIKKEGKCPQDGSYDRVSRRQTNAETPRRQPSAEIEKADACSEIRNNLLNNKLYDSDTIYQFSSSGYSAYDIDTDNLGRHTYFGSHRISFTNVNPKPTEPNFPTVCVVTETITDEKLGDGRDCSGDVTNYFVFRVGETIIFSRVAKIGPQSFNVTDYMPNNNPACRDYTERRLVRR